MATFSVELPDTLTRQMQRKRVSQEQLETLFFRVLHLYLNTADTDVRLSGPPTTLRDLRGSIPVAAPQEFDAIRQQVISKQIRQRMSHGS